MDRREVDLLLDDFCKLSARSGDPGLAAIEAALFIEQTFGLEVAESEISAANFGTPEAVRRYVAGRMGTR